MPDDEVLKRLDRIIAILQLSFHSAIQQSSREIRADPVNQEILERSADDWISSGQLSASVSEATGAKPRTVARRLADLLERQAIQRRGGGGAVQYKSTGLV